MPTLNTVWLIATVLQATFLIAYERCCIAWKFKWWCGTLALGITGSALLYRTGRETHPWRYFYILVVLEIVMQVFRILAVLEVVDYLSNGASNIKRRAIRSGIPAAVLVVAVNSLFNKVSPAQALRTGIESISIGLVIVLGIALFECRKSKKYWRCTCSTHHCQYEISTGYLCGQCAEECPQTEKWWSGPKWEKTSLSLEWPLYPHCGLVILALVIETVRRLAVTVGAVGQNDMSYWSLWVVGLYYGFGAWKLSRHRPKLT